MLKKNIIKLSISLIIVILVSSLAYIYTTLPFRTQHYFQIKKAKSLLTDDYSKRMFDNSIDFFTTYSKRIPHEISPYHYIDHPVVHPNKGDTVLDIGVSGFVDNTEKFIKAVGTEGRVIGIEANPNVLKIIRNKLGKYSNFSLYHYAIWIKSGKGLFALGDNPDDETNEDAKIAFTDNHLYKIKNVAEVDYITVDDFVKKHNIQKLDYIKFCLGNSEIPGILGSLKTIKKFKPDINVTCETNLSAFTIILKLNSLNLGYKFYMCEYLPYNKYFRNFFLFATTKEK